jgi:hypothetical protein
MAFYIYGRMPDLGRPMSGERRGCERGGEISLVVDGGDRR